MEAKLIKKNDIFYLYVDESWSIASTDAKDNRDKKLSLKNCQAIELGYDLDELALYAYKPETSINHSAMYKYLAIRFFKEGFQKALEIIGDKKFSSRNILKSFTTGVFTDENSDYDFEFTELMKDLQQTEWDVEIVGSGNIYKTVLDCCPNYHPKFGCSKKDDCSCKNNELPKLDTDGCLILKRKI